MDRWADGHNRQPSVHPILGTLHCQSCPWATGTGASSSNWHAPHRARARARLKARFLNAQRLTPRRPVSSAAPPSYLRLRSALAEAGQAARARGSREARAESGSASSTRYSRRCPRDSGSPRPAAPLDGKTLCRLPSRSSDEALRAWSASSIHCLFPPDCQSDCGRVLSPFQDAKGASTRRLWLDSHNFWIAVHPRMTC